MMRPVRPAPSATNASATSLSRPELLERVEVLEWELKSMEGELDFCRRQIEEHEKTIHEMLHSSSWRLTKPLRVLKNLLRSVTRKIGMLKYLPKFFASVRHRGLKSSLALARRRMFSVGRAIIDTGFELSAQDRERQEQRKFDPELKISILVPLFNTDEGQLAQLISSIKGQTYVNWELCLADASDDAHEGVGALCREHAAVDARVTYQKLATNGGIAQNTNEALSLASGDYLALLDHDDALHPSALYEVMRAITERQADFIYSDEADFSTDPRQAWYPPHHKPDFSPDTLRSYNYICHLMVFSRALQQKTGLFRSECDGSQDYDMALRLSEHAECIVHIPKVLYYWRKHGDSYSQDTQQLQRCIRSAKRALSDHLDRTGLKGKVKDAVLLTNYRIEYAIQGAPLVSIIIPNKDHVKDLDTCLKSILDKSSYGHYEIIVVENNSVEQQTFEYYKTLPSLVRSSSGGSGAVDATDEVSGIHTEVITYEGVFNFSAINNFAAQRAKGEVLLFLNNDTEVISPGWIEEMLMFAQRADVAAVGARLRYPDDTVQHAGVILGIGGVAGHAHKSFDHRDPGYMHRLQLAQNFSAVTGACLMVRAEVFWEVDGFDEGFAVAFNDVDLCMRFRARGYLNVFTPFAELYHHESKSRGYEDTLEKRERFRGESFMFRERWARELDAGDPYYNPHLSLESEDFSFAPPQER